MTPEEEVAKIFTLLEQLVTAVERMAAAAEQDAVIGKETLEEIKKRDA